MSSSSSSQIDPSYTRNTSEAHLKKMRELHAQEPLAKMRMEECKVAMLQAQENYKHASAQLFKNAYFRTMLLLLKLESERDESVRTVD